MNYEIVADENYNKVEFVEGFVTAEDLNLIEAELREGLAEIPYLIMNFEGIGMLADDVKDALVDISILLKGEEGLLIVAAAENSNAEELDEIGVTCIPTVDEAVDFAYMDRLEKELGAE